MCTLIRRKLDSSLSPLDCDCLALRQATRHVTQFYDHVLASTRLRVAQFSMLTELRFRGPVTINELADDLLMDRTTLGRNVLPLERDGLILIRTGRRDRRRRELYLTRKGRHLLDAATPLWAEAQSQFEAAFGRREAADMRTTLRAIMEPSWLGSRP